MKPKKAIIKRKIIKNKNKKIQEQQKSTDPKRTVITTNGKSNAERKDKYNSDKKEKKKRNSKKNEQPSRQKKESKKNKNKKTNLKKN